MSAPNYLAVRPDWLALRREEALEPDLPIVDAHHHLWDRPGWRYLLDAYRADIGSCGHDIVATVYVQAQSMYRADGPAALRPVGEVEFANGIAALAADGPPRICAAIVGHAASTPSRPRAACSRATSRSTRDPTATEPPGTRSSA